MLMTPVVTLDGPAGAGKSTVAKRLAARLGLSYLDTGALYRALAFVLDRGGVLPAEGPELLRALEALQVDLREGRVWVGSEDVTEFLRSSRVDSVVSSYAALPPVRERLLDLQRQQARSGGLVAEGRDMGTVVFPRASLKIFLTASDEERARRRFEERRLWGEGVSMEAVREGIRQRDDQDSSRGVAPLRPAEDAVLMATDGKTVDEVVEEIVILFRRADCSGA